MGLLAPAMVGAGGDAEVPSLQWLSCISGRDSAGMGPVRAETL